MPDMQCPKCESAMERGFILDRIHVFLDGLDTFWVEGTFERGTFNSTKNIDKRRKHPITAYRCTKCGYLELYAK